MASQKIKIKNHCEITSSKRIFASEYLSSGVPFYRGKEISAKQKSSSEINDPIFISHEKYLEIKSEYGVPLQGDILLTSVGTIGNPYLVKENEEFYFKDGNLTWFRNFKGLNSQWLYYWLLSPQGKSELNKCTIGASQRAYTINLLEGIEIELPDLPTQTRVASALSVYDALIENNEKRINILEEMAQRLYVEYFIKYKFPGYEKVRIVDSGTEYGQIPEGWEVKRLGDVIELAYGKALKSEQRRGGNIPVYGSSGHVGMHNERFVSGPGIVVGRKGNVGAVYWVDTDFYPIDTTFYVKTSLDLYYIYFVVKSQKFISGDAAVPGLNRSQACMLKIIVPENTLLSLFSKRITGWFNEIRNLRAQIKNLHAISDLLIPQLVAGKRLLKNYDQKN